MKKNCHNCVHLEFFDEEPGNHSVLYPSGFYCESRQYRGEKEERVHLINLADVDYRSTSKKCCELKAAK
jgi:hypothetical protein